VISIQKSISRPVTIWRVLDERPGHRNQVLGLTEAISRLVQADCHTIEVAPQYSGFRSFIPGRTHALTSLPKPDLLIAAGHTTHLPLLRFQWKFGGKTTVVMKPTIPLSAFSLALIPSTHQFRSLPANVVLTEGPINRVRPSTSLSPTKGLILIGGISDHYEWSDQSVINQIKSIVTANQGVEWTVTTSRRTPSSFLELWRDSNLPVTMVPCERTPPDWVPQMMSQSGWVWVTSDSMSMLFEAMTAGAAVGVLELAGEKKTRVCKSVERLIATNRVTTWTDWSSGKPLQPTTPALNEADRCATEVIRRLLSNA